MEPDAMILVFWMLSFKSAFSLSSFTFLKGLFSSSSPSTIRAASSAYLRLLISQVVLVAKNPLANAGDAKVAGSIPGSGRSPGEGNGNPRQYSCLRNLMDRETWQATAHRVAKSCTRLKSFSTAHKPRTGLGDQICYHLGKSCLWVKLTQREWGQKWGENDWVPDQSRDHLDPAVPEADIVVAHLASVPLTHHLGVLDSFLVPEEWPSWANQLMAFPQPWWWFRRQKMTEVELIRGRVEGHQWMLGKELFLLLYVKEGAPASKELSQHQERSPLRDTWGVSNAQVTTEEENSALMTSATLDQTFPEVHAKLCFPFTGSNVFPYWLDWGGWVFLLQSIPSSPHSWPTWAFQFHELTHSSCLLRPGIPSLPSQTILQSLPLFLTPCSKVLVPASCIQSHSLGSWQLLSLLLEKPLRQRLANCLRKGPDSKYFRLSEPFSLCHNCSVLLL